MKKYESSMFAMVILTVLVGCSPKEEDVRDPAGTITFSLNYTSGPEIVLYSGPNDEVSPKCPSAQVKMGIRNSSMNFEFDATDYSCPGLVSDLFMTGIGGEVVNLGKMRGLGDVTEKPGSGWAAVGAVEEQHGYVVRFKHSTNIGAAIPYNYARLYVEDYLISTSGGMLGAKVKYQLPF